MAKNNQTTTVETNESTTVTDPTTVENDNAGQLPSPPSEVLVDHANLPETNEPAIIEPVLHEYYSYSKLAESIGNIRNTDSTLKENHAKRRDLADSSIIAYRRNIAVINGLNYEHFAIKNKANGKWYPITAAQFFLKLQNPKEITEFGADNVEKDILRGGVDVTCSAKPAVVDLLEQYPRLAKVYYVTSLSRLDTKSKAKSSLLLAEVENIYDLEVLDTENLQTCGFELVNYRISVNGELLTMPIEIIKASYDAYNFAGFDVKLYACIKLEADE
jgi:hypothetical protein